MKPKRKLKDEAILFFLLLPQIIIICQLFFIGKNIKEIANKEVTVSIVESRCYCG